MRSHPSADVHADGGDLGVSHPNSRAFRNAARLDAEVRQGIDQRLLDGPHVSAHIALPLAQVEDGKADDLPRPVIGNIAAAIGGMEGDTRASQDFLTGQKIVQMAVASQGDGVRMLQQDELVGNGAGLAIGNQPLLPLEGSRVFDAARLLQLAFKH